MKQLLHFSPPNPPPSLCARDTILSVIDRLRRKRLERRVFCSLSVFVVSPLTADPSREKTYQNLCELLVPKVDLPPGLDTHPIDRESNPGAPVPRKIHIEGFWILPPRREIRNRMLHFSHLS